jgi:phosphoenolpyruvate-protein kinase (PTS system EI component)
MVHSRPLNRITSPAALAVIGVFEAAVAFGTLIDVPAAISIRKQRIEINFLSILSLL